VDPYEKDPAEQFRQDELATLNVPGGQASQDCWPASGWVRPPGHAKHRSLPSEMEKVFGGHSVQLPVEFSERNVPAGHATQAVFCASLNQPPGHSSQRGTPPGE